MAESLEQVPSDDCNRFLEDELEALRSIYISETNVYEENDATIVSLDLHPATADNLQEQYVKLTLKLTVRDGYPDVIPEIEIRNPRGLSDEKLSRISNDLLKMAEDKRGSSMLFEIIEAAKDYLTKDNRPCEECAICLYGFHVDDIFTKTECYHYFHSHCLARYAKNSSVSDDDSKSEDSSKNELLCPVCRLPIHFDGIDDSYPSPVKAEDEFSVTDTILQTQKKLQELYVKQVEKGGIIDLEAEKNKYLIEISNVPSILDATSEAKSEDDIISKMSEERDKTQATSLSENTKNAKPDSQKYSPNRPSNSDRSDRRFSKYNEDRRRNEVSDPHAGNDYRNDRYQSNRGNNRYRRDTRGGRNNYERKYDSYNSERSSGSMNINRFNYPKRGNWHENQQKGNRYERYDDRNSQRYEKHHYDDKNNKKNESHDKNDGENEQVSDDPKSQRNKQDPEEGAKCKDDADDRSHNIDQKSEDGDNNVQDEQIDKVSDEKRNNRYGGDRKNMSYRGGYRKNQYNDRRENRYDRDIDQKSDDGDNHVQDEQIDKVSDEKRNNRYGGDRKNTSYRGSYRNNQYDDRKENRYDRQNASYDNNKRYGRYDDNRAGQYERRNGRFDNRKYNEHSGSRRNDNFAPGKSNRPNEVNRNRNFNQDIDNQESKFSKENEVNVKNTSPIEKERTNSQMPHETVDERSLNESEPCTDPNESSKHFSKDEGVSEDATSESRHELKSDYFSDRKQNFPDRNSGTRKQNENRNYNRQYQRSNANGDRYNGTGGYSKQPNYHSERRQSKPQNFRHSNNLDEGENSNALNSNETVAEGASEPKESNVEEKQAQNNEESDDFPDNQHSRKSSARTEQGNTSRYKNYRDGKQGYNNRYQNNNRNYHETRPYRSNPRSKNNQSDYSDQTSNGGKRYIPQKYASDSSYNSARTDNDSDCKPEIISKENVVEPVPVETPSKKPTQVPLKSSELEKSVPTSNFLPPMSSVAPPPGFQNPTRKIVYGLAAANPPPGFNRS